MTEKIDVWKRCRDIERDKREKQREMMEAYNRDVYYPAMFENYAECLRQFGKHGEGEPHNNGFGTIFYTCPRCGVSTKEYYKTDFDKDEEE